MERSKAKADKFRFIDEEKREKVILSLKCIFSCAVGLLLARAKIFGSLSPLGLAFSAAAGSYALAASVGALVGYLLSFSGTAGIRYMACVAGIALINFSVSRLRGENSARKVAPIGSALCCASTGSRSARRGLFAKRHCVFSRRLRSHGRDDISFLAFARAY